MIPEMKSSGLYQDIMVIVDRIARNAESLVLNMDNNAAECYNAVVTKFTGGKRINFTSRQSYQTRCEAASIAYNTEPGQIQAYIHKKITNSSPGTFSKKYIRSLSQRKIWRKSRKSLFPIRRAAHVNAPADEEYGAVEESTDMSVEQYKQKEEEYLNLLKISPEEKLTIQLHTIGQSNNMLWRQERSFRLTASYFAFFAIGITDTITDTITDIVQYLAGCTLSMT
ncbi:dystroglycan-related [Holotrichia oblita]|uniref:Dystroglycan-related n=1 Tax=Holotrichia oblita TaxID=644536 RepID=A0ACB9TNU1_HOLOL|nr:dystroglycan-related [Holotrichia oblita]